MIMSTMMATNLTNAMPLVSKEDALKALSQLTSVVVGRNIARDTDYLTEEPVKRIELCQQKALESFKDEITKPGASQQLQRKLSSLESLKTLSTLFTEVDFDDV